SRRHSRISAYWHPKSHGPSAALHHRQQPLHLRQTPVVAYRRLVNHFRKADAVRNPAFLLHFRFVHAIPRPKAEWASHRDAPPRGKPPINKKARFSGRHGFAETELYGTLASPAPCSTILSMSRVVPTYAATATSAPFR